MNKPSRYRDSAVTIRSATWADMERVELLADLDSAEVPPAPHVLAFVGDELWVAVSVTSGAVIADPFRPSAAVAALARERARQLSGGRRRRVLSFRRVPRASTGRVGLGFRTAA